MPVVRADGLSKQFGDRTAVRDVSFSVGAGEVIGLVGPNGAGKTTTIRMLLDIVRPDAGQVFVFGAPLTASARERIGYLPEERGLYRSLRIIPNLVYLAELKGMPREHALSRANQLLDRLGLEPHRGKKVSELSRGLAQLVQFAAALVHEPPFLVLDEPFSGLDPVNARLMKDIVVELRAEGATIMLSTHQMTDVEELCERVIMIDRGRIVLDGPLTEIKRRFADKAIFVASDQAPDAIGGVHDARRDGPGYVLRLADGHTPEEVLRALLDSGAKIDRFELATPSLEEIFLLVVEGRHA